jgi:hypothetical protein
MIRQKHGKIIQLFEHIQLCFVLAGYYSRSSGHLVQSGSINGPNHDTKLSALGKQRAKILNVEDKAGCCKAHAWEAHQGARY